MPQSWPAVLNCCILFRRGRGHSQISINSASDFLRALATYSYLKPADFSASASQHCPRGQTAVFHRIRNYMENWASDLGSSSWYFFVVQPVWETPVAWLSLFPAPLQSWLEVSALPYGDWFISYPYPQPEHEIRPKPCMMWTEDQARWVPRRQRSGGDVDSEVFVPENVIPFNEKKLLLCEWCMCEKLEQDDWYVSYLGFVVIRGGGCWTVPGENSGLKQLVQHQRHWLQQGKCAGQRCKTTLRSNW